MDRVAYELRCREVKFLERIASDLAALIKQLQKPNKSKLKKQKRCKFNH